jgi:hypothetical protein
MPDTPDFSADSLVSEANNDVVFLHNMLEEVVLYFPFTVSNQFVRRTAQDLILAV